MEPTVIRKDVQAFLQVCHGFAGFVQNNGLTTVEHDALATAFRMLDRGFKPSSDNQPRSYLPVDG